MAMCAIALGIALGFAIHLINGAAFNEFTAAVNSIAGQSDLQLRNGQNHFDEALFPQMVAQPGVVMASPVLELDAKVPGQSSTLKILGLDAFRAAAITPDLLGVPAADRPFDTLADDAIFLSPAAMVWLHVQTGDKLVLRSGMRDLPLRVAGGLLNARAGQRIAVMDIAAAQWRFDRIGQLSRIDLKLNSGIAREDFKTALARQLGDGYFLTESQEQEQRSADMSRAYRVNLNVLALVA
jgi:putative ABC transport system permease protein